MTDGGPVGSEAPARTLLIPPRPRAGEAMSRIVMSTIGARSKTNPQFIGGPFR